MTDNSEVLTGSGQAEGWHGNWVPDFRVKYSRAIGWQIAIVSRKGSAWASKNVRYPQYYSTGGFIQTDLGGVNELVHGARRDGLTTEYLGPRRIVRF